MKRLKRIFAMALALCICMSVFSLPITAATVQHGNFQYEVLANGTARITAYQGEVADLIIPFALDGYRVTQLGDCAITYGAEVRTIHIPDSITYISPTAFDNCLHAIDFEVDENNPNYCSVDGILFSKDQTTLVRCASGKEITSYTIPSTVNKIADSAFKNCSSLTEIIVPNSVTAIGEWVFWGCLRICELTISAGVRNIDPTALAGCENLTNITVAANNPSYCSVGGNLFSKDKKTIVRYAPGKGDMSYSIPKSVKTIGAYAFAGCEALTSITIPNSVTAIDAYAFRGCIRLKTIAIPKSVKAICEGAFSGCYKLKTITISDRVETIGQGAFSGTRYSDFRLNWNAGVLYIGNHLVDADPSTLPDSYTVDKGTKTIAEGAFAYCTELKAITIPTSVKHIGYKAFHDSSKLKKVTYEGTRAQWVSMDIGTWNDSLKKANIRYDPSLSSGIAMVKDKLRLYRNGKMVTGTKTVNIAGKCYAVKNSIAQRAKSGSNIINIGKKRYIVNQNGVVQTSGKKKYKLIRIGKKRYVVDKKGVLQLKKKKIKIGKTVYQTNAKGIAKKK